MESIKKLISKNAISKNILIVILINCILAIVSLLKDIYMGAYLGTSAEADAFFLSFFIIDTIGNNLFATALGVAVIPAFTKFFFGQRKDDVGGIFAGIIIYSIMISIIISAFLYFGRFWVVQHLGSGMSEQWHFVGIEILVILIPLLIVFPLINLGMGILQSKDCFASSSVGPVVFNGVLLLGLILLYEKSVVLKEGVLLLALFIILAVLAQLIFIWIYVIKKCRVMPDFKGIKACKTELLEIFWNFIPYFLFLATTQSIYLFERYLASGLGQGVLSGLNYAFRLVQFPIWVFIAAVSTVAFPMITRKYISEDKEEFSRSIFSFLYVGVIFTLPLTILLYIYRVPIVNILFERGEFTAKSSLITTTILSGYVFCIVFLGFSALLVRVSLLQGNKRIPLIAAFTSMIVTIILEYVFVGLFGAVGIGYGASIGAFVNSVLLYILLKNLLNMKIKWWKSLFPLFGSNCVLLLVSVPLGNYWSIVKSAMFMIKGGYLVVVGIISVLIYMLSFVFFKHIAEQIIDNR
ncbi:MAG: oligosaccharide flippase family protein [Eubacteriales bacterium]